MMNIVLDTNCLLMSLSRRSPDFMSDPTISGGAPTREYKNVWDNDWSN